MSSIDLEAEESPGSDDATCGPDLEYDPAFAELEQAARGKPEQQYGETIIAAEPPDWKAARRLATELLGRTKDVRIAVHLGNASLALGELDAFNDVTSLLLDYVQRFWPTLHPQLDADDDNDPTERINAFAAMKDPGTTLKLLSQLPLVVRAGVGQFSLHDIHMARGDVATPDGEEPPSLTAIEAAFQDCDLESLRRTMQLVAASRSDIVALETKITQQVGVANAASFEPLTNVLGEIEHVLASYLQRRETQEEAEGENFAPAANVPDNGPPQTVHSGEIRGREDVIRAIDRICEYYEKHEPSSPLPLLLNRAKRLATKSFMEIIRDLTPEALEQAAAIGGTRPEDEE